MTHISITNRTIIVIIIFFIINILIIVMIMIIIIIILLCHLIEYDLINLQVTTSDEVEAGTPLYTAPEIIQNLKYSYPVDCWSFGVLLYELLCLTTPFSGSTTATLVNSILNDEPPVVSTSYSAGEVKQRERER